MTTTLPAPNAAMERLEKTWRDTATVADSSDVAHTFRYCADEIATLRQTLAQHEAVAWIAPDKIARLQEGYSATVYGSIAREESDTCRDYATTPLFTAPVAHSPAGVDGAKTGTVADYSDDNLLRRVVRHIARKARHQPAWARISQAFGLGSTYSAQLCRRFDIDPETGKDTAALQPAQTQVE